MEKQTRTRLKRNIKRWSVAILVLGLAGDVVGIVMSQAEMAALNNEASQANAQAKEADERRVELVGRILSVYGQRQVNPEQSKAITGKLIKLRGTKVDLYVLDVGDAPNSNEFRDALNLGRTVLATLGTANLDVAGWIAESCTSGTNAKGLNVAVPFGTRGKDEEIAQQILSAFPPELRAFNEVQNATVAPPVCTKFSRLGPDRPNQRNPGVARISVIIGRKVEPILTREMLETPDKGRSTLSPKP